MRTRLSLHNISRYYKTPRKIAFHENSQSRYVKSYNPKLVFISHIYYYDRIIPNPGKIASYTIFILNDKIWNETDLSFNMGYECGYLKVSIQRLRRFLSFVIDN